MSSIIYTPKDIYEQDFKKVMRGYDPREVDEFLDDVIKDYETYIKEIKSLKEEIEALKKNEKSSAKNSDINSIVQPSQTPSSNSTVSPSGVSAPPIPPQFQEHTPPVSATNLDILKRISRLEKEVFGKQIVE